MSNQLTKRYPVTNVVVSRLRSRLFENSAIVASLIEGEEVTEDIIEEILSRLEDISSINSTLRTFNEHFGKMPKDIRSIPPKKASTPQRPPSPDIYANVQQPPGPDELMKKLNSEKTLQAPGKKGCKDCKKPKKPGKVT
jgi:hypothetical protein|tara:strand:- start:9614 stop:10030 length:417 start_codon:yes stop_codon:yes gene_type:complete